MAELLFPATAALPGGGRSELLQTGCTVDRPPFHPAATAVCTVRWLRRCTATAPPPGARAGVFGCKGADDLSALAAAGLEEVVRIEAGNPAAGTPWWAGLLGQMQLLEVSRFCAPPAAAATAATGAVEEVEGVEAGMEVAVLELLGWIEERALGPSVGGATLYMERRAGVNDSAGRDHPGSGGDEAARLLRPPEPLAEVLVWCRANGHGTVAETRPGGAQLVVDELPAAAAATAAVAVAAAAAAMAVAAAAVGSEDGQGGQQACLLAELWPALDKAVRWMRPGESAELAAGVGAGWTQAEVKVLAVANPKPAFEMGPVEKLAEAAARRAQGNDCYKAGDWERALNRYVLAAAAVAHSDKDSNFDDRLRAAARVERALVALNVAATALQLGDGREALTQCEEALEISGERSAKVLWRRGKAHLLLGDGEAAVADLKEAEALVGAAGGARRQIRKELAKATALATTQRVVHQDAFRGMFPVASAPACPAPAAAEPVLAGDGGGGGGRAMVGAGEFLEDDPEEF